MTTLTLRLDNGYMSVDKTFPITTDAMFSIDFWEEMANLSSRLEALQSGEPVEQGKPGEKVETTSNATPDPV
jgi:hypothetical protein